MDNDYSERKNKYNGNILLFKKEKYISTIDNIPERYKRREYIIDKIYSKKNNVDIK